MSVNKGHIEFFIPQRAPFVMIDNLLSACPEKFESEFLIPTDNIFLDEGILNEAGLIENIAQTGAAGLGVINRTKMDQPVDGFIGGISKLKVYELPAAYDTLYTIVSPIAQLGGMFLMKGENFTQDRKLLECEIKLVGSDARLKMTQ